MKESLSGDLYLDFYLELLKIEEDYVRDEPARRYKDIAELFEDKGFQDYIRKFWPTFVGRANDLCLQNGKLGQECGKMRERALLYLLYRFIGEDVERCDLDSHSVGVVEKGKDVIMFGTGVSVKTVSWGKSKFNQLKVSWIEDKELAAEVERDWEPDYDILLARLKWGSTGGGIYYISKDVQKEVAKLKTANGYSKGTAFTDVAQEALVSHKDTLKLSINMPSEYRDCNYLDQFFDKMYTETEIGESGLALCL